MTVPLLTLPENGQVHIYINALPAGINALPAGDAVIAVSPRRRPLLLTTCALLLVAGGYALHASTSAPASADILASRSAGNLRFAMPQPPLPNEMPPALRPTPPRPYDNSSFASGPLPAPGSAAPTSATPGAPPPTAPLGPPPATAPAANPFGLR